MNLQVRLVWGLHACGRHTTVNHYFSHLERVSAATNQLRDTGVCLCPLMGCVCPLMQYVCVCTEGVCVRVCVCVCVCVSPLMGKQDPAQSCP